MSQSARLNTSSTMASLAKAASACFRDFTTAAVYLVVQIDLLRGKAVRCGKLDSPLDFRSLTTVSKSRHTRQQRIDSKIYRIEFEDVVALHLHCNFYCLVFSRCREMRAKLHTDSRHTRLPLGLRPPRVSCKIRCFSRQCPWAPFHDTSDL